MTPIQNALGTIKQTLDAALKIGAITNLEHANAVIQAFATIQQALLKQNDTAGN
jgi:hypothetical protein